MKRETSPTCPVFVISLEGSQNRQGMIAARLRSLGLEYSFFPGVDGSKLTLETHPNYYAIKRRLFFGRDLSNGEFGCLLAHRNLYRHLVENDIEMATILEDDAVLTDLLPKTVDALQQLVGKWDLVRFLGREKNYRSSRPVMPLVDGACFLSRQRGVPGGAYGYIITQSAAKKLLTLMDKNWLAIDTLHGAVWMTRLKTYTVAPSPVIPDDNIPSCIDGLDNHLRWNKRVRLTGFSRLLYPATRGLWKLYLNLCVASTWVYWLIRDKCHDQRSPT